MTRRWSVLTAVGAAVTAAVLAGCGSGGGAPYADQNEADAKAPQSLVQAAGELGFHATTDPGSGQIEGAPAEAAQPPRSKLLLDVCSRAPDFELQTPQGELVKL